MGSAAARDINLNDYPVHVRAGWSPDWIHGLPAGESARNWKVIGAAKRGDRSLRVSGLGLSKFKPRAFLTWKRRPAEEFTYLIGFPGHKQAKSLRGLLLAQIGESWEVYLNGRLLKSALSPRGPDGLLLESRSRRSALIPIPPGVLRPGENMLALRIQGDADSRFTGLFYKSPYVIGDFEKLRASLSETVPLAFLLLYLMAGLQNLVMFLRRPGDASNLFFSFFTFAIVLYFFSVSYEIQGYIADTNLARRVELISLFATTALGGLFFDHLVAGKTGLVTKVAWVFNGLLSLIVLVSVAPLADDALLLWQGAALLIFIPYYLVGRIGLGFARELRDLRKPEDKPAAALGRALVRTTPGIMLLGLLIFAVCAVYDILDSLYLGGSLRLSRYGFFIFMAGLVWILTNRYQDMHTRVEDLYVDLDRKLKDLGAVNKRLAESEEKYRMLVEGSHDIIFTMDIDGNIKTVNRAFYKTLKLSRRDMREQVNIMELVYRGADDRDMSAEIVRRKLEEIRAEKSSVHLKAKLRTGAGGEPLDLTLRLEYLALSTGTEILARGNRVMGDALMRYFVAENQTYKIDNFLITTEEMSRRLVRNLERYLSEADLMEIRIALREILINAIEHGNLAISFDEKTSALLEDRYQEFVAERQSDPRYRDKHVRIEYSLRPDRVVYRVIDQGNGFDHRKTRASVPASDLPHGRGIFMTQQVFDEVNYNEIGNEVELIRKFSRPPETE